MPIPRASGRSTPKVIEEAAARAPCEAMLMTRVGRVLQALACDRALTDDEIRQHAADCTRLMERAYARFERFQQPCDLEEAVLWLRRRDEAHRSLSPAWRAAREAQIRADIGAGYFTDRGAVDRVRCG